MKLSSKHIAFLDFGSFPGTIMFTVGFTYEEVLKYSKKKYDDWILGLEAIKDIFNEDKNAAFACYRHVAGVDYYFLCLKNRFNFSDKSHALLAHEVLHIISFNLRVLIDPMDENESFCYTHTHVMKQCYKILRS